MAYNTTRPHEAPTRPYNSHQHPQYAPPQHPGQERYYNDTGNHDWTCSRQNQNDERPRYPDRQCDLHYDRQYDQQYDQSYGDMNRAPRHLEQQRNHYTESPGYGGSPYEAPPQFGRQPPKSGYQEFPMSQPALRPDYPTRNGYNVAQRQEPSQQSQYSRANASYEGPSQQATGSYDRRDGYRGLEEHQPQLQGFYRHEAGHVDVGKRRPALDISDTAVTNRSHERTPQVTAHGYVSDGLSGNASRANIGPHSYPTQPLRGEKAHPIKPAKERIVGEGSSPDTLSWDNPFPSFPLNKKKAANPEGESLHGSLAGLSLKGDAPHREGSHDKRPETASSKSSHASSRGYERHNGGPPQDLRNSTRPSLRGDSNSLNTQQHHPSRYHQNTHRPGFESKNPQPSVVESHDVGGNGSSPQPVQDSRPFNWTRRRDQTHTETSFPAEVAIDPGQQRCKTMPNRRVEAYTNSGPRFGLYDQPAWTEPEPTPAGYRSPERPAYLQNAAVRSFNPPSADPPGPKVPEYGASHASADHQYARSPQRPPHSKQESYGEVFDSYYNTPQDNQFPHTQSGGSHHQYDIEENVQNLGAMPEESSRQGRGMIDDQQFPPQIQQRALDVPPMPAHFYNDDARSAYQHPGFAAQAHRSRSQPDLRQHRQLKEISNSGFDFGLAEGVRNVASVAPRMNQLSPHSGSNPDPRYNPAQLNNPASSHNVQHQEITARNTNSEAKVASVPHNNIARFPDGGVRGNGQANGHPHIGLQNNGQMRQDTMPGFSTQNPRDNERSFSSQGRGPRNGLSPINRTGPTSPPVGLPSNPDALPPHPAPVRPGLLQASVVLQNPKAPPIRQYDGVSSSAQSMPGLFSNQALKPIPVRQYNGGPSPLQHAGVAQTKVPPVSSRDEGKPAAVTQEELERLRLAVKANPADQKTQLTLAKKMVDAAAVLADEGGRADQKTKNKNREKYIFDAHKLVKKLVYGGYPEAMFYLADCHGRGLLGLEPDTKEAFNLYQSAAKAGHAQSAYRVAVCCEMGQEEGGGTRRDPLKAIQWYKRAATLGDTPAMYKMGMIQLKGLLGQPKNPREAIGWLKRAADRADEENPHALHELGLLYETASGNDSIIRDEAYSKQLFTHAADLGYKFSQYRLGCAYEYGLMGCPIDPRQSIAWYSRAAVQEEHQSELALSGWYLTGSEAVLQQSDTEAYLWARKAAQAGLAKAEYAMGYFTEVGIGAPANIDDAKRWYWRAASQNFPKARERLEDLRKGGAKMQKSKTISRSAVDRRSDGECNVM